MPRTCSAPFDGEELQMELRAMILADAPAISHALCCRRCGSREVALKALSLAGWVDADFYAALGVFGEQ